MAVYFGMVDTEVKVGIVVSYYSADIVLIGEQHWSIVFAIVDCRFSCRTNDAADAVAETGKCRSLAVDAVGYCAVFTGSADDSA